VVIKNTQFRNMNILDLKNISEIMTKEFFSFGYLFSKEIITKCKEHALPENLEKELKNPDFIGIILEREDKIIGFIVGYAKKFHCFLDYVWGDSIETKKALIKRFEEICREKKIEKKKILF